ncbi:hypothetical protein K525DRAFT_199805 [Schizophyllum commune Loenen D]|nr:hypothetical protein K525DRAFT_199805 [Schizophyllum commune Loenen D]
MTTIPSEALSSCKNLDICSVVNHRIIDLDQGRYRRQIEHFEYYWGMRKGELDLSSPLNHIQLREDMVEALKNLEWVMMPTKEILDAIYELAEYNKTADIQSRRHFLKGFPEGEYEYDFVPLFYLKHRNTLYIDRGTSAKAYRTPYRTLPRLRSPAHPFFVTFFADDQLDRCCATVMPEKKAHTLKSSIGRIIRCWMAEPPSAFLEGDQAIWKAHRHPLSDDGRDASPPLRDSRRGNGAQGVKTRSMTRAPCRQKKTTAAAPKPYAKFDSRPVRTRGSALPRAGLESGDDDEHSSVFNPSIVREWVAGVLSTSGGTVAYDDPRSDEKLGRYQREAARDPQDALDPLTNVMYNSGLIIGRGDDWSRFSSNNWAMRVCGTCLLSSDPPC